MVLDVTVDGRLGHAARNGRDNAIYKVLDETLRMFRDYRFPERIPLGPANGGHHGKCRGTHNNVPDRCTFVGDIRSNEYYTNQELFDERYGNISM